MTAKVASSGRGSKPGERRGGRQAGVPNKLTRTVKMMVLEALEGVGGVKYLMEQAKENPVAFISLLRQVMPTQVVGDVNHRFVARIPAPEGNSEEWLKKYSPPTLPPTSH